MRSIVITGVLLMMGTVYAQCPTAEAIAKDKKSKDVYGVNSQSRSASLKSGETYEMSFIAQDGMDYRLTTKLAPGATGTISYEVYETVVEKKTVNGKETYKRSKHVLASSGEAGAQPLEFTTDRSRKMFVAVTVSGGDAKKPQCVGVLLEDKKTTKIGF